MEEIVEDSKKNDKLLELLPHEPYNELECIVGNILIIISQLYIYASFS